VRQSFYNRTTAAKGDDCFRSSRTGERFDVKGVGERVREYKIDFGPRLSRLFWKGRRRVALLLGSSEQQGQAAAIAKLT
jgi:putative component of toxin-antitoxin plasmid stabilization module